ncbi:hypothetical protein MHYP_G00024850 [Metynnis hypsauchen]
MPLQLASFHVTYGVSERTMARSGEKSAVDPENPKAIVRALLSISVPCKVLLQTDTTETWAAHIKVAKHWPAFNSDPSPDPASAERIQHTPASVSSPIKFT